jgi:hypothetical protein
VADRLADPRASDEGALNRTTAKVQRAELLQRLGSRDEARTLAEQAKAELAAVETSSRAADSAAVLGITIDTMLGEREAARAAIDRLLKNPSSDFLWPTETGRPVVYALAQLGDATAAFDLVEQAMDRFGPVQFSMAANAVAFDGLREHPRYRELEARYEAWRATQGLPSR